MTRIKIQSAPLRSLAAAAGVSGALLLAGCSTTPEPITEESVDNSTGETPASEHSQSATTSAPAETTATSGFKDGSYSASGSYQTPESVETIDVTLSLADGVVTGVEVIGSPQARQSQQYQEQFIGGIAEEVVGKPIEEVSVDRVAGSSLTSGGFNEALDIIRAEAQQ